MRILIAVATWKARLIYAVMKALFPPRRKVVFLSRQSDAPSRDFLMLAEELRSRYPDLEIVIRCRTIGRSVGQKAAAIVPILGQMYHLATARACVVDGYVIPVSVLDHRPELFVVQMWHALGAFKKFGYQSLDRPGGRRSELAASMRMHRNYDVVTCGGPDTVPVFAEAFGVEADVVRPLGLPRLDYLLAHAGDASATPVPPSVAALRRRFPPLVGSDRKVVLYAPTFRREGGRYSDVLSRFSGEGYTLVVKPHPLESVEIGSPGVVDAGDVDVLDLLPLCDAVITDYSAVAFEAWALDLPVLFWVHDIDDYRDAHGLNLDPLVDMPAWSSRDLEAVASTIDSGAFDMDAMRAMKRRFLSAADGRCTVRIADAVSEAIGVM